MKDHLGSQCCKDARAEMMQYFSDVQRKMSERTLFEQLGMRSVLDLLVVTAAMHQRAFSAWWKAGGPSHGLIQNKSAGSTTLLSELDVMREMILPSTQLAVERVANSVSGSTRSSDSADDCITQVALLNAADNFIFGKNSEEH